MRHCGARVGLTATGQLGRNNDSSKTRIEVDNGELTVNNYFTIPFFGDSLAKAFTFRCLTRGADRSRCRHGIDLSETQLALSSS